MVTVRTEDEAEVFVPNFAGRSLARVARPGELARATVRAPLGARTVCCKIPHEDGRVCVPIRMEGEDHGHADCFAR